MALISSFSGMTINPHPGSPNYCARAGIRVLV
jgi:hypothetical protein